ncbi:Pex12 amino terminal region-domain-containing protein [Amanita rubescens]|nr:Pex12 amino terminal region-domain-containing protein [Amanita rubescens]
MSIPTFPRAQQAQIIRANQRDVYHLSSLKEETENILRTFLGTRWLARWDKELDLIVKLLYYGLTMGRATQTLGEEYTDIWQYSSNHQRFPPRGRLRLALVMLLTLPQYLIVRWSHALRSSSPWITGPISVLRGAVSVASELNLAIFYIGGVYYDLVKRALGIQYLSSTPENPHIRPPSYSLLGIMLAVRLVHRLVSSIRSRYTTESDISLSNASTNVDQEMLLDDRPVSSLVGRPAPEDEQPRSAEDDEGTILDIGAIPEAIRAGRNCTLCLEERTNSCSTECGHLFCWDCIVGWGREKAECPLCRQSLDLTRLLPIYNL